jgi:quercetin dioxygenase-like cupin family protein
MQYAIGAERTSFEGRIAMSTVSQAPSAQDELIYRRAGTGPAFWGPGDHYTFLVTGGESGGAYFVMEALVPPGGGPPPHIHTREDETFYLLAGELEFLLGDEAVLAGPGDFVSVPRGTVHRFQNTGSDTARVILTFTPAGIERWFEETLEPAPNHVRPEDVPDNVDEVAARYAAAAPRYGIHFV